MFLPGRGREARWGRAQRGHEAVSTGEHSNGDKDSESFAISTAATSDNESQRRFPSYFQYKRPALSDGVK